MTRETDRRLTELETALAYQEETIQELSDVVKRQWDEIDALKREIQRLEATKADAEDAEPDDQPPPHY